MHKRGEPNGGIVGAVHIWAVPAVRVEVEEEMMTMLVKPVEYQHATNQHHFYTQLAAIMKLIE